MHQYRVTKYDPAFRDASGAYTKKDWTSFGDISRSHNGVAFSEDEYLRVESAYIDAARKFIVEYDCRALRVLGIENRTASAHAPRDGSLISVEDLPAVCRSILREEFWCRLEAEGRFLHFGYDYYMYVAVKSKCAVSIAAATASAQEAKCLADDFVAEAAAEL